MLLTLLIMASILLLVRDPYRSFDLYLLSMVVLLLPGSQSAVQIVTYLVTSILSASILPKLDFSKGIPGRLPYSDRRSQPAAQRKASPPPGREP